MLIQFQCIAGLEHALQFTAVEKDGKRSVHMRSYKMVLKKSGTRIPRVELEEMGPRMDLVLRRSHLASDDLFDSACKQVKVTFIFVFLRYLFFLSFLNFKRFNTCLILFCRMLTSLRK